MMAASLRSTAAAAGRAILLSIGLAGLGAAIAPADWPPTTSIYSEHMLSPAMGYAAWGATIALGLETIWHLAWSLRARRRSWALLVLALSFEVVLIVALFGTAPTCNFCDDVSATLGPMPMITFVDEAPKPSGSTADAPAGHQDDPSR